MSQRPKITKTGLQKALKIFSFIKPYRWPFIWGMICLIISSSMFMIFPGAAGEMANAAIGKSKWNFKVQDYGLLFLVILLVQGVLSYLRTIFFAQVSEKGISDVRKALYSKILCQEIYFFEQHRVGELTSRLTADVEQLQSSFSITLAEFVRQIVILVSGVIILAWMAPKLSLIMLLTFPITVIAFIFFGKYIRGLSKKRQDALAETNIVVEESLQSFHTVKAYSNEKYELNRFVKAIDYMVDISLHYAKMRGVFFIFIITVLFGGLFFILWRGALLVQAGEMQAGDLFSFIIYTGIIGGAIAGIGNLYSTLAGSIGATERIQDMLDRDQEVNLESNQFLKLHGNIQANQLSFVYPSRSDMEVLKEIEFNVAQGQRIAFVGSSGSGKSTIVQLLLRFYPNYEGEIKIDGKSIKEYEIKSYRSNFAIVPQEILLFGGTIRENILYGNPNANESQLIQAANQSNCMEFIESFPEGFDTIVGERGIKLSGGQKQRIAIARAILKNPTILILDEATSALDAESEKVVQDALDQLMQNRTSIIIAHRLSTIRNCDCIYVLKDGQIVERGTHEELLAIPSGVYHNLIQLQLESKTI
ncbi:MAG TPA: ABC transporter ATP-binding protein [Saprospiraceae bacterium]|nr:ABC transporter ATP-binding protein [Saprospiraceae bacterium]